MIPKKKGKINFMLQTTNQYWFLWLLNTAGGVTFATFTSQEEKPGSPRQRQRQWGQLQLRSGLCGTARFTKRLIHSGINKYNMIKL
jgi:hypothetical protein